MGSREYSSQDQYPPTTTSGYQFEEYDYQYGGQQQTANTTYYQNASMSTQGSLP